MTQYLNTEQIDSGNGKRIEITALHVVDKCLSGYDLVISNLPDMIVTHFILMLVLISDDQMQGLIFQRIQNKALDQIFRHKMRLARQWRNDLVICALERVRFHEDIFAEVLRGINPGQETPVVEAPKTAEEAPDPVIEEQTAVSNIIPLNGAALDSHDILGELVLALQLEQVDGKHKPPDRNYKRFVRWIVDNNYDDYLTQSNFFKFIDCPVKEENIKRYYREAREKRSLKKLQEKEKNREIRQNGLKRY
jgi:hypothetical protein